MEENLLLEGRQAGSHESTHCAYQFYFAALKPYRFCGLPVIRDIWLYYNIGMEKKNHA